MRSLIISVAFAVSFVISTFGLSTPAPVADAQVAYSQKIYVNGGAPTNSQSLNILDPVTGKVSYITGFINGGLETSPDGTRLYVSSQIPNNGNNDQIQVIDTATDAVIDHILTPICSLATVSPDGTKLLVTSSCRDSLTLIDAASHAVLKTVSMGRYPVQSAISSDGKTAYTPVQNGCFACNPPGSLWVTDLPSGTVKAKIPVGFEPMHVAVNQAGTRAYVTNFSALNVAYGGNTVSILDLTNNTKITDVTVGRQPNGVVVTPNGQKVYVASILDNRVDVIDGTNNSVGTPITAERGPSEMVMSADGSKTYVGNSGSQSISVIDNATNNVIITYPKVSTMGPSFIAVATTYPAVQKTAVVLVQGIGTDLSSGQIQTMQQSCGQTDVFPKIVQALNQSGFPCSNLLLYSYTGGSIDQTGRWVPKPYSCDDTANQSISVDENALQSMLRLYQKSHQDTRFVLIGHSLGGVIALQASAFTSFPNGTIPAVITIDSPLNHASAKNVTEANEVVPFSELINSGLLPIETVCKVHALLDSVPTHELGDVTNNLRAIKTQQNQIVSLGQSRGTAYMTVGNNRDCVWYLTLCKMPRVTLSNLILGGNWNDDRLTMIIDNADFSRLYNLGTAGCDLTNLPLSLVCLPTPHGLVLQDPTALSDILNFVKGKL